MKSTFISLRLSVNEFNIFFDDPENKIIDYPIKEIPFPGSALAVTIHVIASIALPKKVRGKLQKCKSQNSKRMKMKL